VTLFEIHGFPFVEAHLLSAKNEESLKQGSPMLPFERKDGPVCPLMPLSAILGPFKKRRYP
jgi:hypothetical protein